MRWWRISSPLGRQEDFNLPTLELKSTLATQRQDPVPGQREPVRARPQELQRLPLQRRRNSRHVVQRSDTGIPGYRRQSTRVQHRCWHQRQRDATGAGAESAARRRVRADPDGVRLFRQYGRSSSALRTLEFEEFNSPPVVESADTGPFFHNHTVADLESAVAFYGTPAFQTFGTESWGHTGEHQRGTRTIPKFRRSRRSCAS